MAGYLDILRPQVLTKVVAQVVSSADAILNFLGMQPGGSNETNKGHGREGTYHIYDDSRRAAKGRAPGTAAARSAKQPMKAVPFVYPRMHDSVGILAEFFHNIGRIEDPSQRDEAGKGLIMRQAKSLSQMAANWRVAQAVGMLRDSLYFYQDGDDWHPTYTSTSALYQVNFRVPSGNKSQLNMTDRAGTSVHSANIIDVPWSSPGANIPQQFAKINVARAVQGVGPVKNVLCNSIVWNYLVNNDYLATIAGTSNAPFTKYERVAGTRPDGSPLHEYVGSFNALPGVLFHVTDEGLELYDGATNAYVFAKHFPDTMAVMLGEPIGSDKYSWYQGSEPIAEYDGGPKTVRTGLSAWSKDVANPTQTELYVLDNGLAVPHDPYDLIPATVAGF